MMRYYSTSKVFYVLYSESELVEGKKSVIQEWTQTSIKEKLYRTVLLGETG